MNRARSFIDNEEMEYRQLGQSGLKVSALSFGAGTFGGSTEFFRAWGDTGVSEARELVDVNVVGAQPAKTPFKRGDQVMTRRAEIVRAATDAKSRLR